MSLLPGSAEFVEGSKTLGLPLGKYYVFLFSDLVVQCTGSKSYKLKGSHRITENQRVTKISDDTFSFEMEEAILHFKESAANVIGSLGPFFDRHRSHLLPSSFSCASSWGSR